MKGKRGLNLGSKGPTKKAKRSKKFWQQRKTNTISQVQTTDSESENVDIAGEIPEEEPSTEYQKLLESFGTDSYDSKPRLVSDSDKDDEESHEEQDSGEGNLLTHFALPQAFPLL